jgi:hemoglobin-like flavoprotein
MRNKKWKRNSAGRPTQKLDDDCGCASFFRQLIIQHTQSQYWAHQLQIVGTALSTALSELFSPESLDG